MGRATHLKFCILIHRVGRGSHKKDNMELAGMDRVASRVLLGSLEMDSRDRVVVVQDVVLLDCCLCDCQ